MKILHLDIETAPVLGLSWGVYEQNILEVMRDWYLLGFGYQWQHLKGVHWVGQPDFPAFKKDRTDDKGVAEAAWKLLDEADVVVAHNGKQFDVKKLNARFIIHGLPPPSPYRVVDTKQIAKRCFGFSSNKLDQLSRQLEGQRKIPHTGKDLWLGCMNGNEADWRLMERYCKQDVALLKRLYDRFLPWISDHPNWNLSGDRPASCPKCGSAQIQARGSGITATTEYQRFQCQRCGGWFRGGTIRSVKVR